MAEQPQRRQDEAGAPVGLSGGRAVSPALRARLLDPASWREGLEAYAAATTLAVALVDAIGRLRGPCLNPRPTWRQLSAPPDAATQCPFAVAPQSLVEDGDVRPEAEVAHAHIQEALGVLRAPDLRPGRDAPRQAGFEDLLLRRPHVGQRDRKIVLGCSSRHAGGLSG